jgi:hypothetical protein
MASCFLVAILCPEGICCYALETCIKFDADTGFFVFPFQSTIVLPRGYDQLGAPNVLTDL